MTANPCTRYTPESQVSDLLKGREWWFHDPYSGVCELEAKPCPTRGRPPGQGKEEVGEIPED